MINPIRRWVRFSGADSPAAAEGAMAPELGTPGSCRTTSLGQASKGCQGRWQGWRMNKLVCACIGHDWCICLHCPRNQRFQHWQGEISGAKSSRSAMKFVLRSTSMYQHGISAYEKMLNHVLPCTVTSMNCLVLTCTALYSGCQKYVLVLTRTYFWSFVCTSTYRYVRPREIFQKYLYVL